MTDLSSRRWRAWALDTVERVTRSFAAGVLSAATITEGATLDAYLDATPWAVGASAAIFELLVSLAAKRRGNPNDASVQS